MAHSVDEGKGFFEDWLAHFAGSLKFSRFLDVGRGAGVYPREGGDGNDRGGLPPFRKGRNTSFPLL